MQVRSYGSAQTAGWIPRTNGGCPNPGLSRFLSALHSPTVRRQSFWSKPNFFFLFPSYLQRTKVSCAKQSLPRVPHCSSERSFPKGLIPNAISRGSQETLGEGGLLYLSLQGQTCVTQMLASPNHNEAFSWKPAHRGDPRALRVTAAWYFLPSESNKEGALQGGVRERKGKGKW